MEQNMGNAFSVMLVGMGTVFLILWLVVIIGNMIIRVTNRWAPVSENNKKVGNQNGPDSGGTIAAIVAAVETLTNGKGKVTKITKV
jgi:oxaloacetate decarboxylase gamma subunit